MEAVRYFFDGRCFSCCIIYLALLCSNPVCVAIDATTPLPPNIVPIVDGRPSGLPEILVSPDDKGKVCTLASLEATIVIWPNSDEANEVRVEMPEDVTVSTAQRCTAATESGSRPLLVITWSSFQLCFYISKNEQNWTVDQIAFAFNTSDVPLGSAQGELKVLKSKANAIAGLQAPLGSSYRCWAPKQYPLFLSGGPGKHNATLLLSNFQMQPFTDDKKVFGEEIVCPDDSKMKHRRRHRDATVTVAVGSTLAVVAVVTVLGYGIFRHVKNKAVGYDTMQ